MRATNDQIRQPGIPGARTAAAGTGRGFLLESGRANEATSIAAAIEEDIVFRRLEPGRRLIEDELMERFGAKRHVVRHALAMLDQIGIVQKAVNKGAAVRTFSREEVENIYAMRDLLQGYAARLIRLPASPVTLAALDEICDAFERAVQDRSVREMFYLNETFHDTLFAECGNPYLCESISRFAWLAHAIRSYVLGDPDLVHKSQADHRAMVEAYRTGDREALERLCRHHIRAAKNAYLQSFPPATAPG